MKLIVQVKLLPIAEQVVMLKETLRHTNAACDWLSKQAWMTKTWGQFALHKAAYAECRATFPNLSAQIVVRSIAKVADAYKLDRETKRSFRSFGSIAYDARILSWKGETVSIWTVEGRQRISFVCGDYQRELLLFDRGETDLVFRKGKFYLFVTVDVPDTEERKALEWLGVDVGIVNIATTSDGENFSGSHSRNLRRRGNRLRAKLQRKGTKSAKRLLKKRRCKEANFSKHVNHVISKRIVDAAERTDRGIALENLRGIRSRIRANRRQRPDLHSWAFADLQTKIVYKAKRAGVQVRYVDPRNTSRECRSCGHTEKRNRLTRDKFVCLSCGVSMDADVNAACVIARRADVNRPYVGSVDVVVSHGANLQSPVL